MTTIGTAVLQIIPSLKGVTEEIEKQLDGKTIEVPVQPKVDKTAAQAAGKDAGEAIAKEVKEAVGKGDVGKPIAEAAKKAGSDAGKALDKPIVDAAKKAGSDAGKAIDTELTKATKDTGTKVSKTVSQSVSENAKSGGLKQAALDAAKEFEKGLVSGVASGITTAMSGGRFGVVMADGLTDSVKDAVGNSKFGTTLGSQVTDQLIDGVAGAFKDSAIGETITGALNGVGAEIAGPVNGIVGALNPLRSAVEGFKGGDVAGGLQHTADVLKSLESVGVPPGIADGIQHVADTASNTKTQVDSVITPLQTLGQLAGPESKLYKASGNLPLVGAFVALLPAIRDANTQLEGIVQKYTGLNVPLSGESWVRWLTDNGAALNSAEDNARDKLAAAQAAAAANAAPIYRDPSLLPTQHGRAGGGMIPGFSTRDDRLGLVGGRGLIGLAGGEGIVKATATRRLGGAPFINWLNGFADGGIVPPDVAAATALSGTGYSQGARTDCSGMVARVIDRTLGMPESGLMSTKTAAEWLKARGFVPGVGGPGQVSVGWYDHGPNPNDGHMAMTLSDGRNAEAGGANGVFTIGGKSAGASSPQFDQHMHLPTVYGEGPAGSSAASAPAASAAPASSSGGGAAPSSSSGGGGISLPSSISGLSAWGLDSLPNPTAGLPDTLPDGNKNPWKQDSAKKFGEAASAAVGGQVASALGVFGVPDSPGWLKGISTLVSGISIGGKGGSAAPAAATPSGTGAPRPDDPGNMHGTRAGQQPGPVFNTTIQARDAEDALDQWRRWQNDRTAAKLSRY